MHPPKKLIWMIFSLVMDANRDTLFFELLGVFNTGRHFPFTKTFGKFQLGILGISVWEESVPFVTSPIRLQAPLRRFTKKKIPR